MKTTIVFFASEVSVICELNPYRNVHDTFLEVWKRTAPAQITQIEKKIKSELSSRDEKIKKLIKKLDTDGKISKLVKKASAAKTTQDVKKSMKSVQSIIPKMMIPKSKAVDSESDSSICSLETQANVDTESDTESVELESSEEENIEEMISNIDSFDLKNDIIKSIESQINCAFGTQQESTAIHEYEETRKTNVRSRNDKFHKRVIDNVDGCAIIVGGKVDGIKEDGTVIEVKNRMNRFFDPLPKYDIAQLQTYLFILKASKGELVEQLRGNKVNIKSTSIDRDIDMWNTIIEPRIVKFGTALFQFMNDVDLQLKFVMGNDWERECLVNELL